MSVPILMEEKKDCNCNNPWLRRVPTYRERGSEGRKMVNKTIGFLSLYLNPRWMGPGFVASGRINSFDLRTEECLVCGGQPYV